MSLIRVLSGPERREWLSREVLSVVVICVRKKLYLYQCRQHEQNHNTKSG